MSGLYTSFLYLLIWSFPVLWFNPSCLLSPTHLLAQFPSSPWRRIRGAKVKKLMGWAKDNLTGEVKQWNSFTMPHGQAGAQPSSGKQGSSLRVPWENKWQQWEHPPPSFFLPQLYMLSMAPSAVGYPFGVSCPKCAPSQPHWWGGVRRRKGPAIMETSLNYQRCFQHKFKT